MVRNSYLQRVSKNSTKKKASITNHKDAQTAEKLEKLKAETEISEDNFEIMKAIEYSIAFFIYLYNEIIYRETTSKLNFSSCFS